jgi:DNA-binding LytR/AlgR family response regulator
VENKTVWVVTIEKELFSLGISISALTEHLSSTDFFRINRQTILGRKIIKGFQRLDYQKLEVILKTDFSQDLNLVVSKYNSPIFKKWLNQNHSTN